MARRALEARGSGPAVGVCERTFRRSIDRYEGGGRPGLIDKRLERVSHRQAPVDEVMALVDRYRTRHQGWNVKHFHDWYKKDGGTRSYTWGKKRLQEAGAVEKAPGRGKPRQRRERAGNQKDRPSSLGSVETWMTSLARSMSEC